MLIEKINIDIYKLLFDQTGATKYVVRNTGKLTLILRCISRFVGMRVSEQVCIRYFPSTTIVLYAIVSIRLIGLVYWLINELINW